MFKDSVSGQNLVFSTNNPPIWESGELKFKTGNEYIQLFYFPLVFSSRFVIRYSAITVNIWIKLQKAPDSSAYIYRHRLKSGQSITYVRIQHICDLKSQG